MILGSERFCHFGFDLICDILKNMEIMTIGYEGADIDDFVFFLKKKKIKMIVDIRINPISRKKGFSKNKLAQALGAEKIDYLHLRGLGTPMIWRRQAEKGIMTRQRMFERYQNVILPRHPDELKHLLDLAKEKRTAILCYEADPLDCHRSRVTDELKSQQGRKLKVTHLKIKRSPNLKSPTLI